MIICRCNEVSDLEIRKFIRKYPTATFELLQQETKAGTTCGRCKPMLQKIWERLKTDQPQTKQFRLPF